MIRACIFSALLLFTCIAFSQPLRLVLPIGHTGVIKDVAVSPDGRRAYTAADDKKLVIWDLKTGLQLKELKTGSVSVEKVLMNPDGSRILGSKVYNNSDSLTLWDRDGNIINFLTHQRDITSASFFPDGRRILTTGFRDTMKIWNAGNGNLEKAIHVGSELIWNSAISRSGKIIAAAFGYEAGIWNSETGEKLHSFVGHEDIVGEITISPDGNFVATAAGDKTVRIWDINTGKQLHKLTLSLDGGEISFNAASNSLLVKTSSISDGASLELFDVATGKKIRSLIEARKEAQFGMFSPDGTTIISSPDEDTVATVWDARTGGKIMQLDHGNYSGISQAVFSADGKKVYTRGSTMDVFDLATGKRLQNYTSSGYSFNHLVIAPDESTVILAHNQQASVWNTRRQVKEFELAGRATLVEALSFTPDGKRLITNNRAGNFQRLWDLRTGNMLFVELYSDPEASSFTYSPSYRKIFIDYKYPRPAELFDTENGVRLTLHDDVPIIRWAFTPDEKYLITGDIEEKVQVWNTETGRLIRILDGKHTESLEKILISQDGKRIIVTDLSNTMIFWELETGKEISRHANFHKGVGDITLLPGSDWMITEQYSGLLKLWNVSTGKLHATLSGHKEPGWKFILSADGKRLFTHGLREDFIKMWDVATGKLMTDLKHLEDIDDYEITGDGKMIVASSSFHPSILVWNAGDGALLHKLPGSAKSTSDLIIAPDNTAFTLGFLDSVVLHWDLATGKLLNSYGGHNEMIASVKYDAKRKQLLTTSSHVIKTDITTSEKTILGVADGPRFSAAVIGNREGTILAASEDHTVQLWDINKKQVVQTFFPVDKGDYFSSVSGGFYKSSPGATKQLHYVTTDLRPVSFEQMDVKYNRPDIVMQRAGYPDTALITSYRKAYEKRVKKLGVDTTVFSSNVSFPVFEIANSTDLPLEQTSAELKLHVQGSDHTYGLGSFNIWVNESPVFGGNGRKLHKAVNVLDTTVTITLSEGLNIIEVSATNSKGVESFRSPVKVSYRPDKPAPQKVYFIGIGINKFRDTAYNLEWSVKDIRDLSKAVVRKHEDKTVRVDTLFDEDVSVQNIIKLKEKLVNTTVNDIVIVSYSGHGLLDKNYNYYLSTHEVNFKEPQKAGLPYEELEKLLDSIPARKKLLLIDACHSGEVDKDEVERYQFVEKTVADTGLRSGRKPVPLDTKLGMMSSFELMQELFVNVSRNTGTTVISAAGGMQFAQEKGDLENGVFTFAVLELMKTKWGSTTVTDLRNYVNRRVPELTKGLQVPTTRSETKAVDWNVW